MKSLQADRDKPWLEKYGKLGHTLVLYSLTGLMYLAVFFLLNYTDLFKYKLIEDPKFEESFQNYLWYTLGSYFGAPIVYGILLYLYYQVRPFS